MFHCTCHCSGYMSPEYAMHGVYWTKSDVFSFGVLLLEIITGKKNSNFINEGPSPNLIGHVSSFLFSYLLLHANCLQENQTKLKKSSSLNNLGVGGMEGRKSCGHCWSNNNVSGISWRGGFKVHPSWAGMCARGCNRKTKHVLSCFHVGP